MGRRHDQLTDADRDLLDRLCRGYQDKEIAGQLGIKHHTLAARVRAVEAVLGAHTRCQAIALYVEKHRKP